MYELCGQHKHSLSYRCGEFIIKKKLDWDKQEEFQPEGFKVGRIMIGNSCLNHSC